MKKMLYISLFGLFVVSSNLWAASPFACGEYNPTTAISTSSNLSLTATAMLASPGHPLLPGSFSQNAWFTIDSFGTGALMGCLPKTSVIEGWSQTNEYNANGTVKQITAKRYNSGGGSPLTATLNFTYDPQTPYYLATAENFCMSIGADKVRYTFKYKDGRLISMGLVPDSGCPSKTPETITYQYGDPNVPSLPTVMAVEQQGKVTETSKFKYNVSEGVIQSFELTSADNSIKIDLGYTDKKITSMKGGIVGQPDSIDFSIAYRNGNQWENMLDPRYTHYYSNWGLTIDYYKNNKVESTLQNTGDPGAQADHFYY